MLLIGTCGVVDLEKFLQSWSTLLDNARLEFLSCQRWTQKNSFRVLDCKRIVGKSQPHENFPDLRIFEADQ